MALALLTAGITFDKPITGPTYTHKEVTYWIGGVIWKVSCYECSLDDYDKPMPEDRWAAFDTVINPVSIKRIK